MAETNADIELIVLKENAKQLQLLLQAGKYQCVVITRDVTVIVPEKS